jgi:hypothetical protein
MLYWRGIIQQTALKSKRLRASAEPKWRDGKAPIAAPNEQPVTVNALRNKRSQIVGEIDHHQERIAKLRIDLLHLDATLRLFDPTTDPVNISPRKFRPPRTHYFDRGEPSRRIYAALRESGTVSATELALAAMAERGIDQYDTKARTEFVGRFSNQLYDLGRRGITERIGSGYGVRWKLV